MIPGVDVSHHQGGINWELVKRFGLEFALIKATEGINFVDNRFNQNLVGAQNVGMVAGAYHFLRSDSDAEVQANHFLDVVGKTEGILCALDVESSGTSQPTISQVYKFAHVFRSRTKNHPLIIYTGRWYWVGIMGNPEGVRIGPLWHSAYRREPGQPYGGWKRFTFWQYTSSGVVPGIHTNADMNWFYGGKHDLMGLTTNGSIPQPDEEEIEMIMVQNKANGAILLTNITNSVLVSSPEHARDLAASGIAIVPCEATQFKRYEGVRIDDNREDKT